MQFKKITLEDKEWITRYLKESRYRGCEFSFSTMMMWREVYQTEVAEYQGTMCYRCHVGREKKYIYSFPAGLGDKKAAVLEIIQQAACEGHDFVLRGFEESWVDWLEENFPDRFQISTSQDEWDYVYSVSALSSLAGSRYHGKRNHISRFMDKGEWRYEPITDDNMEECRAMSDIWYHAQLEIGNISVLKEKPVLSYALDHMKELDLKGGALYLNDRVVAFTIGEVLLDDTFHVHIEKAFSDIQGAYPMINQQFVLHEMQDYLFINREEDDGVPGLRRAKESYYPVEMIKKYKAVLKG